jgi:hypothetical protein
MSYVQKQIVTFDAHGQQPLLSVPRNCWAGSLVCRQAELSFCQVWSDFSFKMAISQAKYLQPQEYGTLYHETP